jgi:adenylate cyclase
VLRSRWLQLVLSGLIILIAAQLRILDPDILEDLRLRSFDAYQQLRPREYRPVPVRFVDLDDDSLARLGQWPWPRTQVATLIEELHRAGAAAIVLDIVFSEPDRTSPARVADLWPDTPETAALRDRIAALPDHDQVLARAIDRAKVVVTGFAAADRARESRAPALKAGISFAGDDPAGFVPGIAGAVVSVPVIDAAGGGSAGMIAKAERDGILRRLPLLIGFQGGIYPTLSVESLRVAQGASSYLIKSSGSSGKLSFGTRTGITHVRVGRVVVPTDALGRIWLYDTAPAPDRRVPAWRIMSGEYDPARIAGNVVFVGSSAAGLYDLHPTPLRSGVSGTEGQAQLVEQMLLQTFLQRPDWGDGAELAMVVVIGLILAVAAARLGAGWSATVTTAVIAGAGGLSWYLFASEGFLLDPVYPAVTGLMVYTGSSLMGYLRTENERRQIRTAFSHYMSPVMVERLARDPSQLRLGGETRELTILFCDLRGFTSISEMYDAEGLTSLVNRVLTPITEITLRHGGTVDKYMGDAMMAFWNAPLDIKDHARRAARAALAIKDCLAPLNAELAAEAAREGGQSIPLQIGVGLNTGEACVGNMGSKQRFDYSALGDEVNLASRLEGLSKQYGVDVVISGRTQERLDGFTTIELDRIRVVGKTVPVTIHALLADATLREDPEFAVGLRQHEHMLQAYRARDWDRADELIEACRTFFALRLDLTKLYDLYTDRIAACRRDPPGADWDGVARATSK